jgi:hypothetical protein
MQDNKAAFDDSLKLIIFQPVYDRLKYPRLMSEFYLSKISFSHNNINFSKHFFVI